MGENLLKQLANDWGIISQTDEINVNLFRSDDVFQSFTDQF